MRRTMFAMLACVVLAGAVAPIVPADASWKHVSSGLSSGKLHHHRFPWIVPNKSFRRLKRADKGLVLKWHKPKAPKSLKGCDVILQIAGLCG